MPDAAHGPAPDEAAFQALDPGARGAFLLVADAIEEVREAYATTGYTAEASRPDQRRVVRGVVVPAGTRLFKLTHYPELGKRTPLSPWWSNAEPFAESDDSARTVFETALLNGVSLREYVRFASAVPLDWNLLDFYVEITVDRDVPAFWGQFAPQSGRMPSAPGQDPSGADVRAEPSPSGDDDYVHYESSDVPGSQAYLPSTLGGVGAWQLYVPAFSNEWIRPDSVANIEAIDSAALAAHLGVPAERVAELAERSRPVLEEDPGGG